MYNQIMLHILTYTMLYINYILVNLIGETPDIIAFSLGLYWGRYSRGHNFQLTQELDLSNLRLLILTLSLEYRVCPPFP